MPQRTAATPRASSCGQANKLCHSVALLIYDNRMHLLLLAACGPVAVPLGAPDRAIAPVDAELPDAEVNCAGGGAFNSIQAAIDAAEDGDLLHVAPCTYAESIDFGGKTLRIVGTGGPDVTTIDGRSGASVVTAALGEGTGTSLEGFTLTGGSGTAAIYADFSALRLEDVVVTDNRGYYTLLALSADLEMANVRFSGNSPSYGVQIYMDRGGLVASDLDLKCSGATYGILLSHGSGVIDRANIACGGAYATYWTHAVGRLQRSVAVGSHYSEAEDDHYDDTVYFLNDVIDGRIDALYGTTIVRNSVVTGGLGFTTAYTATAVESSILTDAACAITSDVAEIGVRNNLFWGPTANGCGLLLDPVGGNDNAAADPLFVDAAGGDYTLAAGSPAIDAGPDEEGYTDMDGSRNDVGVYGGPFAIGGGW